MQFLSFDDWKAQNAEFIEELKEKEVDCPVCDGDGNHQCECGNFHDCDECGGTGIEDGGDVDWMMKRIYEDRKEQEIAKLAKWQS